VATLKADSLFFDTSILLAATIDFGARSELALALMNRVAAQRSRPLTAWHCCLEYYSVSTRLPEEYRLSPEDASLLLFHEVFDRFSIHDLPSGSRREFIESLARDGIVGGRTYDAHIAEVAVAAGASVVVTENRRDFVTLLRRGIAVLGARETLDRLT
jgi:predicted nucleic acid-binding protein